MNLTNLAKCIENNNIEEAKKIISEIGRKKYFEAVPTLIKYLDNTNNSNLRNNIALALSDIGSTEAVIPLINLIKNPKTIGNRGTLLYALTPFDYSMHFEFLVDLLKEDNFEVSRQSLSLIEDISKKIPARIKQQCVIKIKKDIQFLEGKIDFLSEALNALMEE